MADETQGSQKNSPGIPPERRPGERETGDTFTATSEGGTAGGPEIGSPVTPPGEGGVLTGPSDRERKGKEER